MKRIFAACCIFLALFPASATKVRPVSIAELAQNSEQIIYGQIQMSQVIDGNCGVRYAVQIDEVYKGRWRPSMTVLFSSGKALLTGSRYVLFLSKNSDVFSPVFSTSSFGLKPDPEHDQKCRRNRPLYTVNAWGVGAFEVTNAYAPSTKMAIYDDFMIFMPAEARTRKVRPSDRWDTEQDSGGIEFDELRKLLRSKTASEHPTDNS